MRIALLTDSDAFAGTERHIHDLEMSLRAKGVDVRVCCPSVSPLAQAVSKSGGKLMPVEKGGAVDLPAVRRVAGWLKSGEIDLVHAHNGRSALIAAAAKGFARRGRVVLTQHFLSPAYVGRRGLQGRLSHLVHRIVDAQIDHTFAISNAVRDAAVLRQEATDARITTVYNGIRKPVVSRAADAVRESIGISPGTLFVLCAARLDVEKRIDVLINAWREVAAAQPQSVCCIAGVGKLQKSLETLVDASGLNDRVRMLGFRSDITDLMAACDVFVLPSDAEPFGLALVEAMALGRCVVATDAGGPREIVESGISGLLAMPGDATSLANALSRVLGDGSLRERLGSAALTRFENRFRCERMAVQVIDLYAHVLGLRATCSHPALAIS